MCRARRGVQVRVYEHLRGRNGLKPPFAGSSPALLIGDATFRHAIMRSPCSFRGCRKRSFQKSEEVLTCNRPCKSKRVPEPSNFLCGHPFLGHQGFPVCSNLVPRKSQVFQCFGFLKAVVLAGGCNEIFLADSRYQSCWLRFASP